MSDSEEVLFEQQGAVGFITLNRPKSLNALTLNMIRLMDPQLAAWEDDASIAAVVIRGAGERAFCAGGDVIDVYKAGLAAKETGSTTGLQADFFFEEYRLNRRIFQYPKPYIALIDGFTMGGGVGVSILGAFRVATERTRAAMPETAIGLFPDVGGSYFLPRLKGEIGCYLALTGARIKPADCLYSGLANAYIESVDMPALEAAFAKTDWSGDAKAVAAKVIDGFAKDPGEAPLQAQQAQIDRIFAASSVEEIVTSLKAEEGDWARETLSTLLSRSPASMKVSLEQLRRGRDMDFDDAMIMEYRMSQAFMAEHDFYEGVRSVLIDKDHAPKWSPATLEEVSGEMVGRYFEALGDRDLTFS
ncbi:enoyl-CoA hydratase/isomerase family protein [Denitrobaculum tricleocarpae]|uniref:3-hydroxyisobutyryl-CoA hydrolase n=1 Tax=Denitrobaculum tricleocarpae TaxID=2591009 RepID=A0A545TTF3_9PROT|nr:enoyl-CoA hydratase/isomerase family protein [Denitrobaculum tricleocarpae]TQV80495.1 enoyl-CoA hydratase/isomerase family protein [Denitrobaculum tricleocarpae]